MPPRSLAFYFRVSTVSQDFPSQVHALEEFCRRQGWPLPPKERVFAEKVTGKRARRTELDRLLQACRDGHVDTILVYKIDRLGNSLHHLVNLQAELDALKIRVLSASEGIDTAIHNAAANFYRNMIATGAQYNREIISARTRGGLAAAAKAGRFPGRPRTSDAAIARALKLRAQGKTLRAIQKATGLSLGYLSDLLSGKDTLPKPPTKP